MAPRMTTGEPIFSAFGDDPDLEELVEMFVEELPFKIEGLEAAAGSRDWETLRRGAHQMKGAGGSYGFPQVSQYSELLERTCKEQRPEDEILRALAELKLLSHRVRSGSPE